MGKKLICCCGTTTWTRIIGVLQLIGFTTGFVAIVISMVQLYKNNSLMEVLRSKFLGGSDNGNGVPNIGILGLCVLHDIMALILLKATVSKSSPLVLLWIAYNSLFMMICIVGFLYSSFYYLRKIWSAPKYGFGGLAFVFGLLIGIALQWFFLKSVSHHRQELIESRRKEKAKKKKKAKKEKAEKDLEGNEKVTEIVDEEIVENNCSV